CGHRHVPPGGRLKLRECPDPLAGRRGAAAYERGELVRPAQTRTANTPGWSAMANELHTQLEHGVRALAMNLRGAAAMRPLPIPRACPREGAGAVRVNFGRPLLR